jgi:hypothetical protein
LNAAVAECVRLRITGPITIAGENWDAESLIDYLENTYNTVVATLQEDQTVFSILRKTIYVLPTHILITPERT